MPYRFLLLLSAVTLSGFAFGQEPQRQFGPWVYGIAGGAVQQFSTDLRDDAEGSFSVTRWFIQPSIGYAWDRQTSVSLAFGAGESSYKFSDASRIDGMVPWDRIRDYRVSVPIRFSAGKATNFILIPSLRSYAEADADLAEGRSEGLLAGVSWRLSDKLVLGPGFGWFSEPGGSANAFPIVVIDWDITRRLNLATGRGLAASQGPGFTLSYRLDAHWSLGLTGRYEKVRFALAENNNLSGGFGQDRSLPVLFTVDYSPWPMTSLNLVLGMEFDGELRLEDPNGDILGDVNYDPAPVLGFTFRSRF